MIVVYVVVKKIYAEKNTVASCPRIQQHDQSR